MSGGPPHHPHGRQVPPANTAWNHLQGLHFLGQPKIEVPNYFPRQPQHAHMSNEHSRLHPHQASTWHTPTTETMKSIPHSNIFPVCFPRNAPGVDLSLTRNGSQNGELPTTPISLSVRDTNKINSLPPSVLDIQAVELTKCTSPNLKSVSPGLKSISPGLLPTANVDAKVSQKRSNIRVDSILERLNPNVEKNTTLLDKTIILDPQQTEKSSTIERIASFIEKTSVEKPATPLPLQHHLQMQSVIVQPTSSSHDENSNSSSTINVPTPTNIKEEDTISTNSNEDSLDSTKSRRKRKPSKTVRVSKDDERLHDEDVPSPPESSDILVKEPPRDDPLSFVSKILEENKIVERRRSSDDVESIIPTKSRRKTSSESETIDNIAAMVQECVKEKQNSTDKPKDENTEVATQVNVSVIKSKEEVSQPPVVEITPEVANPVIENNTPVSSTPVVTLAQKKATNTHFVEVENKLEEMFAGIEEPLKTEVLPQSDHKTMEVEEDPLLKLEEDKQEEPVVPMELESPAVTEQLSADLSEIKEGPLTPAPLENGDDKEILSTKKTKRKKTASRRNSDISSTETTPKKKKTSKKGKKDIKILKVTPKSKGKKINGKQTNSKVEVIKDIYAYDSGSNASSSKSRGPFIQIKGPRDSPISVNVVNTPQNEEDVDKKVTKQKKYHDDSEYRHKVRSRGLHCSTLSNKYDAQTKDATWICAFCKRGPHATELSGPTSNGEVIPAGDLFGPYIIATDSHQFESRLDDPYDRQFKSKKISKVLDESANKVSVKKGKRKHSETGDDPEVYLGITDTGNKTYEIWAHEDCIVWSPGIYLIGPKIVGLEEAIWTSCNILCKICNLKGANICCLKRGCLNTAHVCCSRGADWQFDTTNFKVYCPLHKTQ